MVDSLLVTLQGLPALALWAAPLVGAMACGLAFLLGRRVLSAAPKVARPVEIPTGLSSATIPRRERRAAPRRKGGSVEVQLSLNEGEPHRPGWVVDRSVGGLCILTDGALPDGARVRVRPRTNVETAPWVEATVRSCRPDGGHFELGCQFHRMPDWNMLLQFG